MLDNGNTKRENSVKVFLIKGINLNQVVKSYNYSKFKTEVTDSKVNEVQKP